MPSLNLQPAYGRKEEGYTYVEFYNGDGHFITLTRL